MNQKGEGGEHNQGQCLNGLYSPQLYRDHTTSASSYLCIIPQRGVTKSNSSLMPSQSHKALCTNERVCSWFVGRLVLWDWVKAAVSMVSYQYTIMAHSSIQCPVNVPIPTPTLTLAHITTPFDKKAVSSLDSQGLERLQSVHNLSSSSWLLSQPEKGRVEASKQHRMQQKVMTTKKKAVMRTHFCNKHKCRSLENKMCKRYLERIPRCYSL